MARIQIISELCGQWGGDVKRAEQMIFQSKFCGADHCKVQLYDTYKLPGENRERWEYLSMTKEVFDYLKGYAEMFRMGFFASAFDDERWDWIKDLPVNKIASSMITDKPDLCRKMVASDEQKLHFMSLGGWNQEMMPFWNFPNVKYFHCLSKYPHTFEEAMENMPEEFKDPIVGYSDHSIGLEACKEAIRRGARVIEKHFTTDYDLQSETESAHQCSMNYKDLEELRIFCDRFDLCQKLA